MHKFMRTQGNLHSLTGQGEELFRQRLPGLQAKTSVKQYKSYFAIVLYLPQVSVLL